LKFEEGRPGLAQGRGADDYDYYNDDDDDDDDDEYHVDFEAV
jgi:hypothetical protein